MLQLLYKYLILNKKVSVPGLGYFYIHRQPASLDFSNKQFVAPSARIAFTEGEGTVDKVFYNFLSSEQQIDEPAAIRIFDGFASAMNKKLNSSGALQLPGLGQLTKDGAGRLHFESVPPLTSFYNNVSTDRITDEISVGHEQPILAVENEPVITEETHELETEPVYTSAKKDYWWVYALIIASISVAAIAYYYYQNGSLR
jgi:hypothetical protein